MKKLWALLTPIEQDYWIRQADYVIEHGYSNRDVLELAEYLFYINNNNDEKDAPTSFSSNHKQTNMENAND